MERVSIVIPVYNSEKTIEETIENICIIMHKVSEDYDYEIILVNDGSKDNVRSVLLKLAKNNKIKMIELSKNFGQHNAIMAGLSSSNGDYIVCMDDDLQTPSTGILKLLKKIKENDYDVVYGKYEEKKHNRFRNFGSCVNDLMANMLINKPKNIVMTSFFIMKRYILEEIIKYQNPYPYLGGLIFRVTDNVGDVLVEHKERPYGKSNYNLKKLLKLWLNGFTNFSIKPLRISTLFGLFFSLASFVAMLVILIQKLIKPDVQLGWTSLIIAIIFFGGIQLLSLGLIGEYIGRIFLCLNKTPQYVIKEKINIEEEELHKDEKSL